MKIGIISNTLSKRNKAGIPRKLRGILSHPHVRHKQLAGVGELGSALAEFASNEVNVVAINGGDGTVSATLTALFECPIFRQLPALAVLPGGMTNMIAGDVGVARSIGRAATRLAVVADGDTCDISYTARAVMRVENAARGKPVYGMFFGTAAIVRAIELCRRAFEEKGIRSSPAVALTLAYLLGRRFLWGRGDDDVFRGDEMKIRYDDRDRENGAQLVALVTTLDRLVLGSRPFWGREEGKLRFTRIGYPPHRLIRFARRVLYGGTSRNLPEGHYVSRNTDRLTLNMACPFTLDGQLFQPSEGTPLILGTAGTIRFVQ